MKKKLWTLAPYLVLLGIDFYLLPLLIRGTGMAILLMLCVMPLIALVSAVIYGVRNGFSILLPALAFLLFLPTVFIYYNSSAWVYAVFYALLVLGGNGLGRIFYQKR